MSKATRAPRPYRVFLSHSSRDRWIARQIDRLIGEASRQLATFLDEKDIEGGDSIPESVRRSLQDCDEFIVLLTRYSIDRPWVLVEIGAAWGLGKRIVPVTDKIAPGEMPDIIAQLKAVDLNDIERYIAELRRRAQSSKG